MKGFPMEGRSLEKPQRAIEPHSQMADNSKNLSMMFITLILAIVVVDQITKVLAFHFLLPHNILDPQLMPPVVIIPHLLQFQYAENTGAAFSIFANHPNFLTALSLLIVPILIVCGWRIAREDLWTKVAFGLICGGAIGNVTDRVLRGFVVDFIDLHWKNAYHWPTFNIADTAICIGIGLFIYANLFAKQSPDTCSDPVGANR